MITAISSEPMKDLLKSLIIESKRPVLVYGWGVHLSHAEEEAVKLAHVLGIPVVVTWGARDLFPHSDPLCAGGFGTHGTRAANFVVQNADWILSVGSRLDSKATGTPPKWFARGAKIWMVDIDPAETRKMGNLGVQVTGINQDAKAFLAELISWAQSYPLNSDSSLPDFLDWQLRCSQYSTDFPVNEAGGPYDVVQKISEEAKEGEIIVCDTGCVLAWTMQAWKVKAGQRFIHAFNQTPMGYGLPAAIGAHYATGKRIILMTGDGSLMVNIGELCTIAEKKLPIKIFLFDNKGHAMCRQTQREWLGSVYPSTSVPDLSFPHWKRLALGFGLWTGSSENALKIDGPSFVHLETSPDADVVPKVKFGYPNEDGFPLISRELLRNNMITEVVC